MAVMLQREGAKRCQDWSLYQYLYFYSTKYSTTTLLFCYYSTLLLLFYFTAYTQILPTTSLSRSIASTASLVTQLSAKHSLQLCDNCKTIMKAVLQRVKSASVTVDDQLVSSIGRGLLVLAGVGKGDDEKEADNLIGRILKSRLWPDDNGGQWKKNVQDIEGEVLCVSQFTLFGQLKKGNKPDFHEAADVETARRLYDYFYQRLREAYKPERVKNGVFQAMMDVELKNDGPVGLDYRSEDEAVTIEVNTKQPKKEKKPEEGNDNGTGSSSQAEGKKSDEPKLPPELLE